jgi:RNA binding exosome subunit
VFLNVRLRAFCHATEDKTKVKTALGSLLPDCEISERMTTGHHGNPIAIFEAKTEKKPEIRRFWERVKDSIAKEVLSNELESRIDGECVLHLRMDKQKAYQGKMEMVKHEDIITVSSKIESYPRKRETALMKAEEFFREEG